MSLFDFDGSVLAVILPVVIVVLLFAYATSRVKVAGANEALVRTGGVFGGSPSQLKVVRAGRVIVLPLVHKLGRLHLSARQINIQLSDAVTKQGIKCAVQGVATVKIGGDEESIRNAAERFLDREDLLDSIVKNVLEGSLRSIVGTLTVEELNYDRQKFQQEVQGLEGPGHGVKGPVAGDFQAKTMSLFRQRLHGVSIQCLALQRAQRHAVGPQRCGTLHAVAKLAHIAG